MNPLSLVADSDVLGEIRANLEDARERVQLMREAEREQLVGSAEQRQVNEIDIFMAWFLTAQQLKKVPIAKVRELAPTMIAVLVAQIEAFDKDRKEKGEPSKLVLVKRLCASTARPKNRSYSIASTPKLTRHQTRQSTLTGFERRQSSCRR